MSAVSWWNTLVVSIVFFILTLKVCQASETSKIKDSESPSSLQSTNIQQSPKNKEQTRSLLKNTTSFSQLKGIDRIEVDLSIDVQKQHHQSAVFLQPPRLIRKVDKQTIIKRSSSQDEEFKVENLDSKDIAVVVLRVDGKEVVVSTGDLLHLEETEDNGDELLVIEVTELGASGNTISITDLDTKLDLFRIRNNGHKKKRMNSVFLVPGKPYRFFVHYQNHQSGQKEENKTTVKFTHAKIRLSVKAYKINFIFVYTDGQDDPVAFILNHPVKEKNVWRAVNTINHHTIKPLNLFESSPEFTQENLIDYLVKTRLEQPAFNKTMSAFNLIFIDKKTPLSSGRAHQHSVTPIDLLTGMEEPKFSGLGLMVLQIKPTAKQQELSPGVEAKCCIVL